jgi:hypothetical protein
LLKGIDFEKADSKGLKTLALCWVYRKRTFSVSGAFRKALTDLITDMHNSNKKSLQVTLTCEVLKEEQFFLLGFSKGEDIELEKDCWLAILSQRQIDSLNEHLVEYKKYF